MALPVLGSPWSFPPAADTDAEEGSQLVLFLSDEEEEEVEEASPFIPELFTEGQADTHTTAPISAAPVSSSSSSSAASVASSGSSAAHSEPSVLSTESSHRLYTEETEEEEEDFGTASERSLSDDDSAPAFVAPDFPMAEGSAAAAAVLRSPSPNVKMEDEPPRAGSEPEAAAAAASGSAQLMSVEEFERAAAEAIQAEYLIQIQAQRRQDFDRRQALVAAGTSDAHIRKFDKDTATAQLKKLHALYRPDKVNFHAFQLEYDSPAAKLHRERCLLNVGPGTKQTLLQQDKVAWENSPMRPRQGRLPQRPVRVSALRRSSFIDLTDSASAAPRLPSATAVLPEHRPATHEYETKLLVISATSPATRDEVRDRANPERLGPSRIVMHVGNKWQEKLHYLHPNRFVFLRPSPLQVNLLKQPRSVKVKDWCWELKFDGNRALWDGFNGVLISRSRAICLRPPSTWRLLMPANCMLDGELFRPSSQQVPGTGTEFAGSLSLVTAIWLKKKRTDAYWFSTISDTNWLSIQFHAFDVVSPDLMAVDLARRQLVLECLIQKHEADQAAHREAPPVLKRVFRGTFEGNTAEAIMSEVAALLRHYAKLGAEGIVLKNLKSAYAGGANYTREWLKAKVYEDCEGRVRELYPAKDGNRKGVIVELPTGVLQRVQFANAGLIEHDLLTPGMLVRIDFMPDPNHPGADKVRTPIIRAIVADSSWEQIKAEQEDKQSM